MNNNINSKIKSKEELSFLCKQWKKENKKIGFTSGSFDILHAGHTDYLNKAKEKCDILIVGLNSDRSIKEYKNKNRPIISQEKRVQLIASLQSCDYVFIFDELNNSKNIEELKPNYYIKAGDYDLSQLTSKEIVEKYGGEVILIPLKYDISTTKIIERIKDLHINKEISDLHKDPKKSKVIFLDRDGTINEDVEYLHEPEKLKILPNVITGLKEMQEKGFKLIIITNQPGIGLGYYKKEDFYKINREIFREVSSHGISISKIYFCPHSKSENCNCRKPKIGLLKQADEDLDIDIGNSYMIGDKYSDIKAGRDFGCKTILVNHKERDEEYKIEPDHVVKDLLEAAKLVK